MILLELKRSSFLPLHCQTSPDFISYTKLYVIYWYIELSVLLECIVLYKENVYPQERVHYTLINYRTGFLTSSLSERSMQLTFWELQYAVCPVSYSWTFGDSCWSEEMCCDALEPHGFMFVSQKIVKQFGGALLTYIWSIWETNVDIQRELHWPLWQYYYFFPSSCHCIHRS